MCPTCREKPQNVHHFLIDCRGYTTQRREMERVLRRDAKSMRALLSNPLAIPTLFRFISETCRFKNTQKDLKFMLHEMTWWKEAGKETERKKSRKR
jgi:hypothetical protein